MSDKKVTVAETDEAVSELEFDNITEISISTDDNGNVQESIEVVYDADEGVDVEDLPDEEEIWPGGPTAKMIKDWKSEYGEVYVTSISFDKHFVWRVLNRMEYKSIVREMENMMQTGELSSAEANMWNEEAICQTCTLYPEFDPQKLTGSMAGVPSLIAQEVLEASGFVALEVRQL
jgi:hypothetical protein